jgi:hypothetical protein
MWGALSDEKSGLQFSIFLLDIANAAFLRSEYNMINEHILLCLFLGLPQPGRYITQLYPRALGLSN